MNHRIVTLAAGGLLVAGMTLATPAAMASGPVAGSMIPYRGIAEPHADTLTTTNWAGYAVKTSGVTTVTGSFVVPAVDDLTPGFAATWAGIGGDGTPDLIQAGVNEFDVGLGFYSAWYELLPAGQTVLASGCTGNATCPVNAGDSFTTTITETAPGSDQWVIFMADPTEHWTFQTTQHYVSSNSSAEWIHEAITVVVQTILPLMHSAHFVGTNTFGVNGGSGETINAGGPTTVDSVVAPADLVELPITMASPSPLDSSGEHFFVCAYPGLTACPS